MTTHILSLTYVPKIPLVKSGECTQTIRLHNPDRPKKVGDKLILHTWAGRCYFSKWDWRMETEISELKLLKLSDGGDWGGSAEIVNESGKTVNLFGSCGYEELCYDDGFRDPWLTLFPRPPKLPYDKWNPFLITAFEKTLRELNGINTFNGLLWDIIRWPKPTIRRVA
jgi:hypothetical protein